MNLKAWKGAEKGEREREKKRLGSVCEQSLTTASEQRQKKKRKTAGFDSSALIIHRLARDENRIKERGRNRRSFQHGSGGVAGGVEGARRWEAARGGGQLRVDSSLAAELFFRSSIFPKILVPIGSGKNINGLR